MVAGLTADVFVQLTATLAHLSSTLNKTGGDGVYPPLPPLPPPPPPNRNPYDGFRKGRKDSYCRSEQNLLRTRSSLPSPFLLRCLFGRISVYRDGLVAAVFILVGKGEEKGVDIIITALLRTLC